MKMFRLSAPLVTLSVLASQLVGIPLARAAEPDGLRIYMFSPEFGGSASKELVGVTNPTDATMSLTAVYLEYQSATGTTWSKKLDYSLKLPAKSDLVAYSTYLANTTASPEFNAGFALAGGRLRLRNSLTNQIYDQVDWGTAVSASGVKHVSFFDGQKVAVEQSRTACAQDSSAQSTFVASTYPLMILECSVPQAAPAAVTVPAVELAPAPVPVQAPSAAPVVTDEVTIPTASPVLVPVPEIVLAPTVVAPLVESPTPQPVQPVNEPVVVAPSTVTAAEQAVTAEPQTVNPEPVLVASPSPVQNLVVEQAQVVTPSPAPVASLSMITLSELYPNPGAGELDSRDEFVEFYNSNNVPVKMTGYSLVVGSKTLDVSGVTVPAAGYAVVRSADTALSLSNAGNTVTLKNILTSEVSSATYPAAEPGLSWVYANGVWSWSTTVTPASVNERTDVVQGSGAQVLGQATAVGAVATKALIAKVTSTLKPKAVAVKAALVPKATAASSAKSVASVVPKAAAVTKAATTPKAPVTPKLSAAETKAAAKLADTKKKTYEEVTVPTAKKSGYYWVVVGLIGVLGYAIWEYRYEIRNYYQKFRGNRKTSSQPSLEF
jgi:Lamin Tail Domain